MHSPQRRSQLFALWATALLGLGCGSNPSGPLDPALSGSWILPSVDTYSMFVLQQRGTGIVGTFGDYTGNQSFSEVSIATGTADLPHVALSWTQGGTHETFNATLSEDGLTLTGVIDPGGYRTSFVRERLILSRAMALHQ